MKHEPARDVPNSDFRDEGHARLLEDVQNRQRNIVWPDTMRYGRAMDALLWRGAPDATTVQRVGIAVFGLLYLSLGLFFIFSIAPEFHSVLCAVLGVLFSALGVRVTFNAFRRNRKHPGQTNGTHR